MRKLSRDARHERRVQVIRLRKAGRIYDEIAKTLVVRVNNKRHGLSVISTVTSKGSCAGAASRVRSTQAS